MEDNNVKNTRPYVLWRRVSTEKQGESGLGLAAQSSIAEFCMGCKPVDTFTDVWSGTKLDECTNLWKAIEYCKENGYLLVIAKTDRMRNVKQALEILDAVGEGNLQFCDLPSTDRMILTIVFAVWEKQAMIGRLNTRVALAERKKELKKNGVFISRSGNARTHLGNAKGCDITAAQEASARVRTKRAEEWYDNSPAVKYIVRKLGEGWNSQKILSELEVLDSTNPGMYRTREGKMFTRTHIWRVKQHISSLA